ncbi:MAG: flagellar basal body P-ring formation chaperone FlgA [Sneathiellaceae bacterium]|uniref:flagellar basal body P-ring formation chaperone FlgA n=1 Tax=Marinovum algicola TaxID=42444 RepID=UPI0032ECD899
MTARLPALLTRTGYLLLATLILATAATSMAEAAGSRTLEPAPPAASGDRAAAEVIYMRGDVTVDGPMVTLGDLLVGVPDRLAEVPVARSPEPGGQGRIRTDAVARAAQAHGLEWTPFAQSRTIEVARRGRLIEQTELTRVILEALRPQLDDGDYDLFLSGRMRDTYVALDAFVNPQVESLDYRPDTGRFDAILRLTDGSDTRPLRLNGQVTEMADLPVLRGRMVAGEVITAKDITYRKTRADRVPSNVITEAEHLIGRSPRRAIQGGKHVRANDVMVPQDVERNEMVTMILNQGGLMLTTTGQALESGARGEVIGIRNLRSKRVVRGVIVGPGEVHMLVANNLISGGARPTRALADARR